MILGYRAAHLAKLPGKPILVLCFNKSLASRLQQVMAARGLDEKVVVRTFHAWCVSMLRAYNVDPPPQTLKGDAWYEAAVGKTIAAVDRGQIPRAQYAAVLIDEGHDFAPEWFKLVVQMLDPETNALLVLYDDAQTIYRNRRGLDFSFASVGIQAQGRTTVLRLNYRNTLEVLSVARAFATELLAERDAADDGVPMIAPESAGRRGAFPELIRCESDWQEWDCVVSRIRDEHGQGRALNDMAVIYRSAAQAGRIEAALKRAGIAYVSAASGKGKSALYGEGDAVKVVSMHSSKGLEFGLVLIPCLGEMPKAGEPPEDEARLLYVAMTRAIDRLVMTYREPSDFTRRVQDSIAGVRERLVEMED
jgi:superfamily I DNA/RNA helicase